MRNTAGNCGDALFMTFKSKKEHKIVVGHSEFHPPGAPQHTAWCPDTPYVQINRPAVSCAWAFVTENSKESVNKRWMIGRQTDRQTDRHEVHILRYWDAWKCLGGSRKSDCGRLSSNFNKTSSRGTLFGFILFYPVHRTSHALCPWEPPACSVVRLFLTMGSARISRASPVCFSSSSWESRWRWPQ